MTSTMAARRPAEGPSWIRTTRPTWTRRQLVATMLMSPIFGGGLYAIEGLVIRMNVPSLLILMEDRVAVVAYSSAGNMGGLVGMVEVEVAGDGVGPTVGFGACGIPDCKNWAWKNLCAELRVAPIQIVSGAGVLRVINNPGLPCTFRSFHGSVLAKTPILTISLNCTWLSCSRFR